MKRIEIFKEENNFYFLPSIKLYFDKYITNGKYRFVYLEFAWFNYAIGIRIIDNP
jgi:hypothetical protein